MLLRVFPDWTLYTHHLFINGLSVWRHQMFTSTTTRGHWSCREKSITGRCTKSFHYHWITCAISLFPLKSWLQRQWLKVAVSDIIRYGENPSMEPAVREKSTGKIVEDTIVLFILKNNNNCFWQRKAALFYLRRKELREQLKRQIEEKCAAIKLQLANKIKEAETLREADRLDLASEREQRIQHSKAMAVYRDENKRVQPHTYIIYPLLMLLWLWPHPVVPWKCFIMLSGYKNTASVWVWVGGFFFPSCFFLCSWTANGAELEGQSTNTFPGGPEWKRAAAPQPHQLEWNTEIGQTSPGGQNVRLRPHCSMCVRWKNGIPNVQCRITKGTNFKTFWITYSRVKKRVHSLSIHSFCIRSLKKQNLVLGKS